ncbi:TPA: hypothetical protein ACV5EY_000739 [Klebsiella aerogenes]|nr:hypothetical protein [Klebsiella aerogenes]HDS6593273.1 hypothetical protein [Klebsiella aerogenes]HDU6300853.1 hypothetical protein [Klebsiella aerogenes]
MAWLIQTNVAEVRRKLAEAKKCIATDIRVGIKKTAENAGDKKSTRLQKIFKTSLFMVFI